MPEMPPELEFAELDDDQRPSGPSPWVRLVALLCLVGLVAALASGLFTGAR